MKAFKTAIVVGVVSAALTWGVVYLLIHEPTSGRTPHGSWYVLASPQPDDDLTALFWAAGAYIVTFTPTLLILRGRTPKGLFAKR